MHVVHVPCISNLKGDLAAVSQLANYYEIGILIIKLAH